MKWYGEMHIKGFVVCKLFLMVIRFDATSALTVRLGRMERAAKADYKKPSSELPEGIKGRL